MKECFDSMSESSALVKTADKAIRISSSTSYLEDKWIWDGARSRFWTMKLFCVFCPFIFASKTAIMIENHRTYAYLDHSTFYFAG